MKMLYFTWGYPYDKEIQETFYGLDIECIDIGTDGLDNIDQLIEIEKPDLCFSIDFNADLSDYCQMSGLKYISWVLVLPNLDLYTESIKNDCNSVFLCDSFLTKEFQKNGVNNVFYLPDAVSIGKYTEQRNEILLSYIGLRYESQIDNFYKENTRLSLYSKGYLDGLILCQRVLYGASILPHSIPINILQELENKVILPDNLLKEYSRFFFTDTILAPDVTYHEQQILDHQIYHELQVYSDQPIVKNDKRNMCLPKTQEETDLIYQSTSINIVIPEKNYYDAIPRQTLEIMACGGFVFSGKQKDYTLFFKNDEDLVYFEDDLERIEKLAEYQSKPEVRKRICESGYEKIKNAHTYHHRLLYMMSILCK